MLTKRIIPCLDVDDGRVVKGVSFVNLRDAGDPAEMAGIYDREGADELVFLDITASSNGRNIMRNVVEQVSERVFIPLTVGGGLRSVRDARRMLEAGADKVSLNTAAVQNPALVEETSTFFGSQCIVVAIDAKSTSSTESVTVTPRTIACSAGRTPVDNLGKRFWADLALDESSRWEVYTHGGRNGTGIDAVRWATSVVNLGAGELLITSMDTDGRQRGYDLGLIRAISQAVSVPVIASGGAGNLQHMYDALIVGEADAVLAASIFHYGTHRIGEAKEYLAGMGVPIRPGSSTWQRGVRAIADP